VAHRSTEVNANLTKGAASTGDVLQLLRLWEKDEAPAGFEQRAIEENLLGKSSRSRARDLVKSLLSRRYFVDGATPARHLRRMAEAGVPREVLVQVLYYHAARAEHLLYLAATELVHDLRERGVLHVTSADVARFVRALAAEGRADVAYSDAVLEKLGQATLTALRDFGALEGKAKKRIAPVRMSHPMVGYLVHALREEDLSAKRILEHPDWRLFLLTPGEVEAAVLEGARRGHYTYSAAGDIRRFDWHHNSLDDYVESLAQDVY
jgi:hypothetical protein